MHYEKPEITDANYLRVRLIPFGTEVRIGSLNCPLPVPKPPHG